MQIAAYKEGSFNVACFNGRQDCIKLRGGVAPEAIPAVADRVLGQDLRLRGDYLHRCLAFAQAREQPIELGSAEDVFALNAAIIARVEKKNLRRAKAEGREDTLGAREPIRGIRPGAAKGAERCVFLF